MSLARNVALRRGAINFQFGSLNPSKLEPPNLECDGKQPENPKTPGTEKMQKRTYPKVYEPQR